MGTRHDVPLLSIALGVIEQPNYSIQIIEDTCLQSSPAEVFRQNITHRAVANVYGAGLEKKLKQLPVILPDRYSERV